MRGTLTPPLVPSPIDSAARRAWQDRQYPAMVPVPPPAHTSRDPWPNGLAVPGGPRALATYAEKLGWRVQRTYAVGPWLGARDNALRRSIGVRCWFGNRFALVFYLSPLDRVTWAVRSTLVAGGPVGIFPGCNVGDVRHYLLNRGAVPAEWFAEVTARVVAAKLKAKEAAATRPRKVSEVHA